MCRTALFVLVVTASAAAAATDARVACLSSGGDAAATCLSHVLLGGNPDPGPIGDAVRASCTEDVAFALGFYGVDDQALRLSDACADFAAALRAIETPRNGAVPGTPEAACADTLADTLARLRSETITLFGPHCFVREAKGRRCKHAARDRKAKALQARARAQIVRKCGDRYAALGLPAASDVVATSFDRTRHFAQLVYPPDDLGPTGDYGPYPVGVRTLDLVDPSRPSLDPAHPGGRPVTVELWYPSTSAAIAGVDRYVVNLFGIDIAKTPTYRDVARAAGPFPVVLFSHGNGGIRFQSLFLAGHLASHGYVVASPDHHGDTFLDLALGIVDPIASSAVNRPLDMQFVLDQLLARNASAGDFLAGAIDPARVGMSGHSFGGYTTFALAGTGTIAGRTFADPRMRSFLALAPATSVFPDAFFPTVTAPILTVGGTLDVTTPFATEQKRAFDLLPSGASIVGLAEITGAGHYSFSDICEVPRNLVALIGGFDEACTPAHLPWHDAHRIVDYLALNFFDATLGGDRAARARLVPKRLSKLDDLDYEAK